MINLGKSILFLMVAILFLFVAHLSKAQQQKDKKVTIKADLSSPYHTVINHLKYLQDREYYPEISAQSLHAPNIKRRTELAIKLKQIFDGAGIYVDPDFIPKNTHYTDSSRNNAHKYVISDKFPEIYVEKVDNKWLYSEFTVIKITELRESIYPFGTDRLLDIAPNSIKKYLGLYSWQYLGLFVLLIAGLSLYKIFTFFSQRILAGLLLKFKQEKIVKQIIYPVARPLSILISIILISLFFKVLQLPISIMRYAIFLFNAMEPFLIILIIYRLVDVLGHYLDYRSKQTAHLLDDQLAPLVRKFLKVFVCLGGILFILQNLNFNIVGLLTGLSIGGLAFALAAQDTIKNLFGSFMIFVDKPFQVEDWIVGNGINGIVEEVGFRSTRVRTFHNSIVSIPNGNIANMTIDNMGMREYRRFSTNLGVTYDTPPKAIEAFVSGLKFLIENHSYTRKDRYEVHLNNFGDFSINILFYIFFKVPTWSDELKCRHEIMLEIIHLADKLEVRFAFPTSTIHVEDFPEKKTLIPTFDKTEKELMLLAKEHHKKI